MTSHGNSRKLHESRANIDKYLRPQQIKHAWDTVAENVHRSPTTRDHHRAFLCSNNMNKTLSSDSVQTANHRKLDRKTCCPHSNQPGDENEHPPVNSLTVQTCDASGSSIVDISQKLPLSAVSSEVDKPNDSQIDNAFNNDLSKLVEKNVVGSARERYLSVLESENRSSSYPSVSTAKYNHRRFEPSIKKMVQKDSNAKKKVSRDKISKDFNRNDESNLSLLSADSRGSFKGKFPIPKQLSKISGAPSLNAAASVCGHLFSEQANLQKCRSSVAMHPSSLRATHCPSPDLQVSQPDTSLSSEILNTATVKSLKSKFGGIGQRQTCKATSESASSHACSPNPHLSGTRVKVKPSSTIQRIQEQLLQQMDNGESKRNNSKIMQKFVHKTISAQHQDNETIVNELSGKSTVAYADTLHKEEKPYRQWYRMSRVVTADSKFIISPMLPGHAGSHTKQNAPLPEKSEELVQIEDTINADDRKDCSVVCEPEDVIAVVDCPPCEQEKEDCETTQLDDGIVKTDQEVTEVPLTNGEVKSTDGETRQVESGGEPLADSITLRATSADSIHNASDSRNNVDNIGTVVNKQTTENSTLLNESELGVRRNPKSAASLSMPRNKSLNMKTFYMMKYQSFNELNEVCTSNTRDRHTGSVSTDVVDRMQPLNSVSGASQVTGPSFSEFKNDPFKLPAKKVVSGGPKLRTATRIRNRCNSPGLTHGSTNLYRGADSQISSCRESSHTSSNVSRHNSRHSRDGSGSFSSDRRSDSARQREQRICTQPRSARGARAQETDHDNPECINRNWSSGCAAAGEIKKESAVTPKKPRKVFLADVASKLMQKVNRASLRAPWTESSKQYTEVKATQDYNGSLPGQLSFRKGQIIKQRSFISGPSDGMCYGYYRVGRLRKKKKGLFPLNCVATDELDALDGVSLTSSAKSAL